MSYVCVRPVELMGHKYFPGDTIAPEHIVPGREKAMKANGRIAEVGTPQTSTASEGTVVLTVPITGPEGELIDMSMEADAVIETIRIMQLNAEKAAEAVKDAMNEDVLILLHNTDSRQSVKKAARTQADKLEALQEESEKEEG